VSTPRAAYTAEARAAKVEGIVIMQAVIQKDGSVSDVKVLRGLGYGLDEATVETVKRSWRFQPPLLNGQPVKIRVNIEMSFRLY
jgi:protein TonB